MHSGDNLTLLWCSKDYFIKNLSILSFICLFLSFGHFLWGCSRIKGYLWSNCFFYLMAVTPPFQVTLSVLWVTVSLSQDMFFSPLFILAVLLYDGPLNFYVVCMCSACQESWIIFGLFFLNLISPYLIFFFSMMQLRTKDCSIQLVQDIQNHDSLVTVTFETAWYFYFI